MMLKASREGPGLAGAGETARGQMISVACALRRERHAGRFWARDLRRATASTSTLVVLGRRGGIVGQQGQSREGRREEVVRHGGDMAGMAMSWSS
jgi:hypothetical protein